MQYIKFNLRLPAIKLKNAIEMMLNTLDSQNLAQKQKNINFLCFPSGEILDLSEPMHAFST